MFVLTLRGEPEETEQSEQIRIWDPHIGDYDDQLLGYDAV
jgi:hypothetical protein